MNAWSATAANALCELRFRADPVGLRAQHPAVLVLLADAFVGWEDAAAAVRRLTETPYRLHLWPATSLLERLGVAAVVQATGVDALWRTSAADLDRVRELTHVVIPSLSPGFVRRLVHWEDDQPLVRVALAALAAGIPVYAVAQGADPDHPAWLTAGFAHTPPALRNAWSAQLVALARSGVRLVRAEQIPACLVSPPASASAPRALWTADAVRRAHQEGWPELRIDKHAIVTPLARDLAWELGITIVTNRGERL